MSSLKKSRGLARRIDGVRQFVTPAPVIRVASHIGRGDVMTPARGLVLATPPNFLWKYNRIVRFVRKPSTPRMTAISDTIPRTTLRRACPTSPVPELPTCPPQFWPPSCPAVLDQPFQEIFSSLLLNQPMASGRCATETSGLNARVRSNTRPRESSRQGPTIPSPARCIQLYFAP